MSTSKVSNRISELQKQLNLNADTLKTSDNLAPWRKSTQPVEVVPEPALEEVKEETAPETVLEPQTAPIEEEPQHKKLENIVPEMTNSVVFISSKPVEEEVSPSKIENAPVQNPQPNPLDLLKGLKELDEAPPRISEKTKEVKKVAFSGDDPLSLLSSLKEMDAEKTRKSTKKKDLFTEVEGRKSKTKLFEDDEPAPIFKPRETGPSLKTLDDKPRTLEVKQRESKGLKKLFDDSDEEKDGGNGLFGGPTRASTTSTTSKGGPKKKSGLFDDDD